MELTEIFRENVWASIDDSGETIAWLAARAKISRSKLSAFLNGRGGITLDRAEKIATALKVPAASMFSRRRATSRSG